MSELLKDTLLPPELWLSIFELLPRDSIRNATHVCQTFRWLAQPLLFATLAFHPSVVVFDYYGRPTHYKLEFPQETADKMTLAQSSRIASFVTTIHIKPIPLIDSVHSRYTRTPKDDGKMQKDAFDLLPHFPNLVTLHLKDLTLTERDLIALASLPRLDAVMLEACDTSAKEGPKIPVTSLSIESRRASPEGALKRLWKVFLQPDRLEHLSLGPWSVIDPNVILSTLINVGPWPKLRVFKIGYGATEDEDFVSFLTLVPRLEELYFHAEDVVPLSDLPSDVVPHLQVYTGPVDTARGILRDRKEVRHLNVYGSGNVNIIDSHILLDRLKSWGSTAAQLWSLQFEAHQLTKPVWKVLCEQFAGLKALSIYAEQVGDSSDKGKGLADWLLEMNLSNEMEYLSVTTLAEEPGASSVEATGLLNTISSRYSRLRYFSYTVGSNTVRWDPIQGQPIKEDVSRQDWVHGRQRRKLRVCQGKRPRWAQEREPVWVEWRRVCA